MMDYWYSEAFQDSGHYFSSLFQPGILSPLYIVGDITVLEHIYSESNVYCQCRVLVPSNKD
jgi:hypothetical protein